MTRLYAIPVAIAAIAVVAATAGFSSAGDKPRLRVLATGDSLIQPLDELLGKRLKRAGGKLARDPRPGTGLTKSLVLDWVRHAKRQAKKYRPAATVVFIGANDTGTLKSAEGPEVSCCRRAWIDAYAARAAQMIRSYMRGTRGRVYWLTLPTPREEKRQIGFSAVNFAIAQAVSSYGERARLVDTVPLLSPGERFRRRLRYRGKRVVVRDRDGVHLTAAGARIVRAAVLRSMRADGLL